jgi:hypothetical protein
MMTQQPFDAEEEPHRYVVGIDLGTTNSALAYVDGGQSGQDQGRIRFFEVPQLVSPGELARRPILPSFLYLPGPYDLPAGSTRLPWDAQRSFAVGELAREQGALVPGRLVASAKSWLCHAGVERTGPILPWGAASDVPKVSPVEASARYLQHLRESWNEVMGKGRDDLRLEDQLVVLTVPASFDEISRELTLAAAHQAGLAKVILLEEPLAAFYAWLSRHEFEWESRMRPGQIILVCDVGGGTTDFSLVAVREGEKGLRFDRLAVGEHLMLGGDNMDLALARHLEMQLFGQPGQLDSRRWHQLWHECRRAKELLLGGSFAATGRPDHNHPGDSVDITIMGAGAKLIAGTAKGTLQLSQVEQLILEGFFPRVALGDDPHESRKRGLTEWGLPFVQDPAVTRHLGAFWRRFAALLERETGRTRAFPDFILFNGGALTPAPIRDRLRSVAADWFKDEAGPDWQPEELENPQPELAVAIGAAYYGRVKLGAGVRVGAGSPRTYYAEVTVAAQAAPNAGEKSLVCLVPRGTEEGSRIELERPAFQVLTNQPVSFQLYCSSTRVGERVGDLVAFAEEETPALPPIRTVLRYGKKAGTQTLPVQLGVHLTEIGTLELWCRSQSSPHRWRLQFDLRAAKDAPGALIAGETLDSAVIDQARALIRSVFGVRPAAGGQAPERLVKDLSAILELGKERWPTPLIRKLADGLLENTEGRAFTPQHEARWLNLLGFCLRPGFGAPLDEWRIKELWKIYPQSLRFARHAQSRSEWWILWRRAAGGLSAGHQLHMAQQALQAVMPAEKRRAKGGKSLKGLSAQEELEILMMLANLERLPTASKVDLGTMLIGRFAKAKPRAQELWALSRLGARMPLYGPLDRVIPGDIATRWLEALLALPLSATESTARAMIQLARHTGDRERDVSPEIRGRLREWLAPLPRAQRLTEVLENPDTALDDQEQDWIFGEALPAGLIISSPGGDDDRGPS